MRSTSCGSPRCGSPEEHRSGSSEHTPARTRHSGSHAEANASDRAIGVLGLLGGRLASRRAWRLLTAGSAAQKIVAPPGRDPAEHTTGQPRPGLDQEVHRVMGQPVVVARPLPRGRLRPAFAHDSHPITAPGHLGERHVHGRHGSHGCGKIARNYRR